MSACTCVRQLPSAHGDIVVSELQNLDTSQSGGGGTSLTISNVEELLGDCHLGDSIAINGIVIALLLPLANRSS